MARGRESFEKRARELKRQTRAASKRDKREDRESGAVETSAPVDEEALMARYGQLSQQREIGEIDEAAFEAERVAIFVELGLITVDD